jgi:GT2 family glycosyltransferase
LLVPPFVFFFQLLYPFRSVADASSPVAAAAGGCMLVRRDVFERAGGFAAISRELIDDVGLAKAIAAVGGRLWLGLDAGIESVRAYSSLASLWRMVARNAFVQLHYSFALLSATLIGLLWFFVLPLPLALWAAASWWRQGHPLALLAALAFFASWILQTRALMPAVLHHRAGRVFAGTLWLAAGFYAGMTLHAALSYLGGRASSWKGRAYAR